MVRYMSDLARSKISIIPKISVVQKNIGSPKTRKFRLKYRDIMDILDHGCETLCKFAEYDCEM